MAAQAPTFTAGDIDFNWFIYTSKRADVSDDVAVKVTASVSGENGSLAMMTPSHRPARFYVSNNM